MRPISGCFAILSAALQCVLATAPADSVSTIQLAGSCRSILQLSMSERFDSAGTTLSDTIELDNTRPFSSRHLHVRTNSSQWTLRAQLDEAESQTASDKLNAVRVTVSSNECRCTSSPPMALGKLSRSQVLASGFAATAQNGSRINLNYELRDQQSSSPLSVGIIYTLSKTP